MKRSPSKDESSKNYLLSLCNLIMTLDSIRAFRRFDPETIKEKFQSLGSKEFTEMWKEIRHDVEKIAYVPLHVKGVPSLMKLVMILRALVPMVALLTLLSITARLPLYERILPKPLTIFKNPLAFVITGVASFATITTLITVDFTIRRRIIRYEETHADKFSKGRERIEKVIERLIEKLAKEIKSRGEDPSKYKMTLYFKYKGLKILREKRGGIFRRKYPIYEAICSIN